MPFKYTPGCCGCGAVATTKICSCDIDRSKTLYYTLLRGGAKPSWLGLGTYELTYSPAPGIECIPGLVPFAPWGEGWYYQDSNIVIAFHQSCGVGACSKGFFSSVGSGSGVVVSCSPLLVVFGGTVLSGTVHE